MLAASLCAVLFDLDGVIVDTKDAHFDSFKLLGQEVGYQISEAQFRHLFGRRNEDIFPELYGRPLPQAQVQQLAERKEAIFRDLIRGKVTALPGVLTLLPALQQAGFHLGIGTSTPRENVELVLSSLCIAAFFPVIVSAEDVTEGKPNPQVFLKGAERLGINPAHCVVVEDAVAGVQAALNGGMKALGVTTNHTRKDLSMATRVVDSLAEVTPDDFLTMLTE